MDTKNRIPKKAYFEMRLKQAIESGHKSKAEYYQSRLVTMSNITTVIDDQAQKLTIVNMELLKDRVRRKMSGLNESDKLLEANNFYKAMDGKVQMSECVSFMSDVIGENLAVHATQF